MGCANTPPCYEQFNNFMVIFSGRASQWIALITAATTLMLLLPMLVKKGILVRNGKGEITILIFGLMGTGEEGTAGIQVAVGEQDICHVRWTETICTTVIHPSGQWGLVKDT